MPSMARTMAIPERLERSLKVAGLTVLLLIGEYLMFVALAVSFGGSVSGAGGSLPQFLFFFAFLAIVDAVPAVSFFAPGRRKITTA